MKHRNDLGEDNTTLEERLLLACRSGKGVLRNHPELKWFKPNSLEELVALFSERDPKSGTVAYFLNPGVDGSGYALSDLLRANIHISTDGKTARNTFPAPISPGGGPAGVPVYLLLKGTHYDPLMETRADASTENQSKLL